MPYYEWVEAMLPVQTAAMGHKERVYFDGCEALGIPVQTTKITLGDSYRPQENAILQPGGNAGLTRDRARLTYPSAFLARKATELLRGAGATKVFRLDWAPLILHVQSTMRMGSSVDDSVLDASAEARWVKRLFIADNSALANAAGGANPTLTTQALATRTAEVIFQRYFGGDPWVGREAPVVSTDDAVTRAVVARGL